MANENSDKTNDKAARTRYLALGDTSVAGSNFNATEARQAFEAWFSNNAPDCQSIRRDAEGNYMLMQAYQAWAAWKRCAEWYSQREIELNKGAK